MCDDPRDRVKREELLMEFTAFINPEFDAITRHQPVNSFCVFYQFSHTMFPPDQIKKTLRCITQKKRLCLLTV